LGQADGSGLPLISVFTRSSFMPWITGSPDTPPVL
jgi:hypothetical protein